MSERIAREKLESYLWDSALLLRDHMDAGSYKQYIFPLLFFKRLSDVYEEDAAKAARESEPEAAARKEIPRLSLPDDAHWDSIRNVPQDVGKAIQTAFQAVEKANPKMLRGIFGDGTWANKRRLPDRLLKDLIEHFSTLTLSVDNCPEDDLGRAFDYLIKKIAESSGHTAQEFYTNRTVAQLMVQLLKPQPGESVYDPTCGSGGMLISAAAYLKEQGVDRPGAGLYGQEINALTSAIGRMNLLLHGIKDFRIANKDTLARPAFTVRGKLRLFDVVLANPPYSISQWDRAAFKTDKYGRNFLGLPPQGRADYAFFQHILKSMKPGSGRCAILFPHGVLFRKEEKEMRKALVRSDLLECVIGLGANLFYSSPMEACIVICRARKPDSRKGCVLFINAVNEVARKNAESFLEPAHIETIVRAYEAYETDGHIARKASIGEIQDNGFVLSIPLYVKGPAADTAAPLFPQEGFARWCAASAAAEECCLTLNEMIGDEGYAQRPTGGCGD